MDIYQLSYGRQSGPLLRSIRTSWKIVIEESDEQELEQSKTKSCSKNRNGKKVKITNRQKTNNKRTLNPKHWWSQRSNHQRLVFKCGKLNHNAMQISYRSVNFHTGVPLELYWRPLEHSCTSALIRASIRIFVDVHHSIRGRPSAFIRTSIRNTVDVRQNINGYPSEKSWTTVWFHTDVHQNLLCASIRKLIDILQLLYGRPSEYSYTSFSLYKDVHQNIHWRPSAFIQTSLRTLADVHHHGGISKGATCPVDRDVTVHLSVYRGYRSPTEQYGCRF